jgi:hypothetical protein
MAAATQMVDVTYMPTEFGGSFQDVIKAVNEAQVAITKAIEAANEAKIAG